MYNVNEKLDAHYKAVESYCEKSNSTLIFTALFGSQNYNLDDENSDVDTKSMIIPDLKEYFYNSKIASKTIFFADNSHAEQSYPMDLFHQFIKGNVNFLEILYTSYIKVNPNWEWVVDCLKKMRNYITTNNPTEQCVVWYGYITQMYKRSYTNEVINYKALMNLVRLQDLYYNYFVRNEDFSSAIYYSYTDPKRENLLAIKQGNCDDPLKLREETYFKATECHEKIKKYYESKRINDYREDALKELNYKIFKHAIDNS